MDEIVLNIHDDQRRLVDLWSNHRPLSRCSSITAWLRRAREADTLAETDSDSDAARPESPRTLTREAARTPHPQLLPIPRSQGCRSYRPKPVVDPSLVRQKLEQLIGAAA